MLGTLFTWKSHFEKAMCFYNASKIFGKSCDLELCFYEKDQSSKNCSGQNKWIIQVSLYFSEYILSKHLLYLFREYVHISLYIHRVIVLAHPWKRLQRESESEENVSWNEIGEVLDTEMSTVEDIRADLARNDKGNTCLTILACRSIKLQCVK